MAITNERLAELVRLYDRLKVRCAEVDEKYSLTTVEPKLDLPESLDLQKLQFVPKTDEELTELANEQVAPYVLSKQRTLEQNYNSKLQSYTLELSNYAYETSVKMKKLVSQFEEEKAEIKRKVINHGLVFSNVMAKYTDIATEKHNADMRAVSSELSQKQSLVDGKRANAQEEYDRATELLEQERAARFDVAYEKLLQQQEKERVSVEKYNNSIQEKEQKYQATRARLYQSAMRAATERALDNAKMYAELGEVGYRDLISREKFIITKEAFAPLKREEAKAILSIDSFLYNNLGTYYSSLTDWINTTLLP